MRKLLPIWLALCALMATDASAQVTPGAVMQSTGTVTCPAGVTSPAGCAGAAAASTTGSGAVVLQGSPVINGPTIAGPITTTGLTAGSIVTNGALGLDVSGKVVLGAGGGGGGGSGNVVGPSSSVAHHLVGFADTTGQLLEDAGALGGITVGSSTITGGTPNGLLFDAAGLAGNLATGSNGILVTNGGGVPSIATTAPSGLIVPSPTVTGSFTATGLVKPGDHATQAANTVLGNGSGSVASPIAQTVADCHGAANAVTYTAGGGSAPWGCNTIAGSSGANPTATAGTTAINGTSSFFMRADAAPAIGTAAAVPVTGVTGLGTGVGTALAVSVGTAGAPIVNGGALGTPSGGTATNLTGTATGLTAGVANGLKSATTTVSTAASTAPTNGLVLTATSGTTATWQAGGCTITANTADLLASGCSVGTAGPLIFSATSPYVYNGTGTSGTGAAVDNTYTIELSSASPAMTLPQAGTTGFLGGVGSSVLLTGSGTATVTPTSSLLAGLASVQLAPHQVMEYGSDGTNWEALIGIPPSGGQNLVLATPNGLTGQPKLRSLVVGDLPNSASTVGTYTNATVTVNAQGLVTAAATGTGGGGGGGAGAIASGSGQALGTSAISSGACTSALAITATGVLGTDVTAASFAADPTSSTGYMPSAAGMLTIVTYPTTNTFNIKVCNNTANSITPAAVSVNWRVDRGGSASVASGTLALGTAAVGSGACVAVQQAAATGVLSTDVVTAGFNGDPTGVTGYSPTTNGMLSVIPFPTSGFFNVRVCNNTSASITPGAITLNWRVLR